MAIKLLMALFALVLFVLSGYLWLHRQNGFLLFTTDRHPEIAGILNFWAIELLVAGLLAVAGMFSFSVMIGALIVGCLSGMGLGLTLVHFLN
ncbi:hypothetical protein ACRYI5_03900 [Furfurilactobacillus sp. WILCCON 0119]|uniref:hypothetical protein n=1 Tax=Furfurilactobacillus entadae TaxID=2922307 RepID=UPI0035EC590D